MDQYRKFDYEISQTSVNDTNIASYLRTECGKEICAGTLFPGNSVKKCQQIFKFIIFSVSARIFKWCCQY